MVPLESTSHGPKIPARQKFDNTLILKNFDEVDFTPVSYYIYFSTQVCSTIITFNIFILPYHHNPTPPGVVTQHSGLDVYHICSTSSTSLNLSAASVSKTHTNHSVSYPVLYPFTYQFNKFNNFYKRFVQSTRIIHFYTLITLYLPVLHVQTLLHQELPEYTNHSVSHVSSPPPRP